MIALLTFGFDDEPAARRYRESAMQWVARRHAEVDCGGFIVGDETTPEVLCAFVFAEHADCERLKGRLRTRASHHGGKPLGSPPWLAEALIPEFTKTYTEVGAIGKPGLYRRRGRPA